MKYILKSLLIIGIMVGGVIALFEYFGGAPATTATGGSSSGSVALPAWLPSLSLVHITYIVGGLVLLLLYFYLTRAVADQAEELLANKLVVGIGKALLIIGFFVLCRAAVDVVYDSQIMIDLKLSPPWRWFWSVMTVALGALLPFQSLANWVVKTDGAFAKAVRWFVVVTLLGVVLFTHAKEGRTLKNNYDDVKPFFAGIQIPEKKVPPPSPPPAPPKEEKKIITGKWLPVGPEELNRPYVWRQPGFESLFRRFRYRAGEKFGMPPIGKGGCITIVAEKGKIRNGMGAESVASSQFIQCEDNALLMVAVTDVEGFMGACRHRDRRCLVYR